MMPELHKAMTRIGTRCITAVVSAVFCLLLPSNALLNAQESEFFINNLSAYKNKSRAAVYFTHENHMETIECLDCHHDFQNGENVLDEDALEEDGNARCIACHSESASIELKTAYHRQCMACHRLLNKQDDSRLPITCQDCHPRNPVTP